jgi:uncharacterized membrane protein
MLARSNMTTRWLCCALVALGVIASAARHATAQPLPCRYEVAAVIQAPPGPLTSSPTFGNAISPNGRYVVGTYNPSGFGNDRAFWFDVQTQQFTPLPSLPGTIASRAYDVSDAGLVVGTIAIPADKGFIYSISTGQYTLLEPINPQGVCEVTGITSKGVVCGTRSIGSKTDPVFPKTAFIWTPSNEFNDLGLVNGNSTFGVDIAEDGIVAVSVGPTVETHWWDGMSSGNVGAFKGAAGLTPWAIGNNRRVVGSALFIHSPPSWSMAFDFRGGTLIALPALDAANRSCTAMDVNQAGLVVGACRPPQTTQWKPCIWVDERIIDLRTLVDLASGITINTASAVNDNGQILCGAVVNGSVATVVLEPVPARPGDTNCDLIVDVDDLITVVLDWGRNQSPGDVNHDGIVNVDDLIIVINQWTH